LARPKSLQISELKAPAVRAAGASFFEQAASADEFIE
jgi:hypothetical protein